MLQFLHSSLTQYQHHEFIWFLCNGSVCMHVFEELCLFFAVWRTVLLQSQAGTATMAQVKTTLQQELEGIKEAGTWKGERIITSKQGPSIHVQGSKNDILNFCANNYLGLSVCEI